MITFQNSWHLKCRSRSWCTTFAVTPFDDKYRTSYLRCQSYVCSIYHDLRDIRKKLIKCQKLDCENRGQYQGGEKPDMRHSIRNVRIRTGDFFRSLATWEHKFAPNLTNLHTHLHTDLHTCTHAYSERQGWRLSTKYVEHIPQICSSIYMFCLWCISLISMAYQMTCLWHIYGISMVC